MRQISWYWAKRRYPEWKKTGLWEVVYFDGHRACTKSGTCSCNESCEYEWTWGAKLQEPAVIICPSCNGSGDDNASGIDYRACSRCQGHGNILKSNSSECPWDVNK